MIAIYDHVQELRRELNCAAKRERVQIAAELAAAIAKQAEIDHTFDSALDTLGIE